MNFPKWESLVITNTYYGVTQIVGICIGSFCTDWMIGGCFLVSIQWRCDEMYAPAKSMQPVF